MNFDYLQKYSEFSKLYNYCLDAENFCLSNPSVSCTCARNALEYIVTFIYKTQVTDKSYNPSLFEMMSDYRFINVINNSAVIDAMHYVRKVGNYSAHGTIVNKEESICVLDNLAYIVGEISVNLGLIDNNPDFIEPKEEIHIDKKEIDKNVKVDSTLVAKYAPKMRDTKFVVSREKGDLENKELYLKASLREGGWPIVQVDNQAMPGCAGINIMLDNGDTVDHVLYGKDNKPLAIIEYNETNKNLIEGRNKAMAKAKELGKKYGYEPAIYYTNGYSIFFIDQLGYPPRRVFQYHTIDELELLKQRRSLRTDISNPSIDLNITGRTYQVEAIRCACKAYASNRRKSLLVMATGTGKTRVAISLVDILMKANYVKNVLFLADRTSLVRQAHKNFNKLLPNVTTSIYTGTSYDRDDNARIIFSTYQTMINLIDDDTREFGIGRFDLIIIDEAHRSIFSKYGSLFNYFDSLMLGLTATPRSQENKSTYDVFELKNEEPDYSYELDEAIEDGYLVGFHIMDRTTSVLKRGVKYDDLSDKEKEQFETVIVDEDNNLINENLIDFSKGSTRKSVVNIKTIDLMLDDLMNNGLKVDGGDKIGKTIIFAENHFQAEKIVERFHALYGHLISDYCKLVDYSVEDKYTIIDQFEDRNSYPQITVSVDMLDTGVDIPDVLNLVFFKEVHSKIKFLQMIGRGTRLSPNIYGPGDDKKGFLIFDYFDNFNYFSVNHTWKGKTQTFGNSSTSYSQSATIYKAKLDILVSLDNANNLNDYDANYKEQIRNEFIDLVNNLNNDQISVEYNMAYVNKYRDKSMWKNINEATAEEINKKIIPLLPSIPGDHKSKYIDILFYRFESLYCQKGNNFDEEIILNPSKGVGNTKPNGMELYTKFIYIDKEFKNIQTELKKLKTIPEIVSNMDVINQLAMDYLLKDFSIEKCEEVRKIINRLVVYIPDNKKYYVIDVDDLLVKGDESNGDDFFVREKSYKEKLNEFINDKSNVVLAKLKTLDTLSEEEKVYLINKVTNELGSEADFANISNNLSVLVYLRKQIGIADGAINVKFGSFLNEATLNQEQLAIMNKMIDYCRVNGDITFLDLQNVSPFSDIDIVNTFGDKIVYIKQLIKGLHGPVQTNG